MDFVLVHRALKGRKPLGPKMLNQNTQGVKKHIVALPREKSLCPVDNVEE